MYPVPGGDDAEGDQTHLPPVVQWLIDANALRGHDGQTPVGVALTCARLAHCHRTVGTRFSAQSI